MKFKDAVARGLEKKESRRRTADAKEKVSSRKKNGRHYQRQFIGHLPPEKEEE